ncbi:MAG: urease accessory protein UreF [Jaaginema sp. PMC 1079.18]|nr:urease accessory protein UreF [Jaaginema sp. PMC 1080.18]MEC4851656.1 urease accessory protein UreF [Jaaginema sp. PMC 1079.18]MEC4867326.1 urease accessory protein UreF [Jaaginema sp. PMC 1078.18]
MSTSEAFGLLNLLQLASPALPVGAYSYSEGIETLVEQGVIRDRASLYSWIDTELCYGSIRIETAMMLRAYQATTREDWDKVAFWNAWLSASRETLELRRSSEQMGQSLLKLIRDLEPEETPLPDLNPCNYAIAFGIAANRWQIDPDSAILAYLQAWTTHLIGAGVKLIPLGQTTGQQLLWELRDRLLTTALVVRSLSDTELNSCNWGLSLASITHETQYMRLFRS